MKVVINQAGVGIYVPLETAWEMLHDPECDRLFANRNKESLIDLIQRHLINGQDIPIDIAPGYNDFISRHDPLLTKYVENVHYAMLEIVK